MARTERKEQWLGMGFFGILLVMLLAVLLRCLELQSRQYSACRDRALRQQRTIIPVAARRGTILDRHGRVLALSAPLGSIAVDPNRVRQIEHTAETLASVLDKDPASIADDIRSHRADRFLWIERMVSPSLAEQIEQATLAGVIVQTEYKRCYPMGDCAGAVLGFTDIDGRGLEGIEAQYDKELAATPGRWIMRSDALRRPVATEGPCYNGRDGNTVVLTLDAVIQQTVEEELDAVVEAFNAKGAQAIVMDPHNGEVLAMAMSPRFDPEQARLISAEQRRNRILTDPFEPGSTFKPFTVAAALSKGLVHVDDVIDCHDGHYRGRGFGHIGEYGNHRYGKLTVAEIVVHSSNIGTAILSQKLGKPTFYEMIRRFGFGSPTGIDLPGESDGIVPPLSQWNDKEYTLTRASFGQAIAVTPLQLIRGFCTFCNGGRLVRPRLGMGVISPEGEIVRDFAEEETLRPLAVGRGKGPDAEQVISPEIAEEMVNKVLTAVVERKGGTANRAALEQYRVFGKTGTAQVPLKNARGYDDNRYISSFIAGAPAEHPRLCVLVSVLEPDRSLGKGYTGGMVAAPVVREILRDSLAYLDVPPSPDRDRSNRLASSH